MHLVKTSYSFLLLMPTQLFQTLLAQVFDCKRQLQHLRLPGALLEKRTRQQKQDDLWRLQGGSKTKQRLSNGS